MNIITSFIPVLLPLVLILVFKLNSAKTMTITLVTFVAMSLFVFHMPFSEVFSRSLNGMFNLLTPMFILMGAIVLLNTLELSGALNNIKISFNKISPDQRIQVIIVGFLFAALIEGISGFGTPATIAAPILISLGFKPIQSIIIGLMCNSFPVSFGATGIPINFGLFEPLEHKKIFIDLAAKVHMSSHDVFFKLCSNMVFMNYLLVPLLLIIVMFIVTHIFVSKEKRQKKTFREMIPLMLLISVVYPSFELLVLHTVGYSFVSILAPIATLFVLFMVAKYKVKFFIPKRVFHEYYGDKNEITKDIKKSRKKLSLIMS